MFTKSNVLKPLPDNTTAQLGFINNEGIISGRASTSLSPEVFRSIKLRRIVASQTSAESSGGPVDNIDPISSTSEVLLGSGGPVKADAATYATTAYYALRGGALPVSLDPAHYAFAPTTPYLINSDFSLSVLAEDSIRIEDLNLIPQDLVPTSISDLSLVLKQLDGTMGGVPGNVVSTASSPCGETMAVLSVVSPVTLYLMRDANIDGPTEHAYVKTIPMPVVSSSAPEYQLAYVTDDIVFVGLRNSSIGYWVNVMTGAISEANLQAPLISCHASTAQFGVASVVVAVVAGGGFALRLCVFGDSSSALLLSRAGTFGDLFLHNNACMIASSASGAYTVETLYDFTTTEHVYTGTLPNSCVPRKIFACDGEVVVLFASFATPAKPWLLHVATNTFVPTHPLSSTIVLPTLRRVRHLPSYLGHLFYCAVNQSFVRITSTAEPITASTIAPGMWCPSLLRGMVVGFNASVPSALLQRKTGLTSAYVRVLANQPESGLVLPYPQIYVPGAESRIYPKGADGYYVFQFLSSAGYTNVGVVDVVERHGQKYVVQLIAYANAGYIEPVLTPVVSNFTPDTAYPDGAVLIFSSTNPTLGVSFLTVGGVTTKVFDHGFFRYQPGWLEAFSTYNATHGLGYPNPYKTDFYGNWDCSIALVHQYSTSLKYISIALPGSRLGSISRSNDLSVDTMDVSGPMVPVNASGDTWFGYLPGATQTMPNSGGIFSFSHVIDTNVTTINLA